MKGKTQTTEPGDIRVGSERDRKGDPTPVDLSLDGEAVDPWKGPRRDLNRKFSPVHSTAGTQ